MISLKKIFESMLESDIEGFKTKDEFFTGGKYYQNADDLIGSRVWIHTNRSHRDQKTNGVIGIYKATSKGRKSNSIIGYTNHIRIKSPIVFDVNISGKERIKKTGRREQVIGISGIVTNTDEGNTSGMVEITFNPFSKYVTGFHTIGGDVEGGQSIKSADEVYMEFYSGKWRVFASNIGY